MKALVKPLTKTANSEKISQADYERLITLYQIKKSQLTLDGKKRVVISGLSKKFCWVSVAGSGFEVEYSSKAVERILNTTCQFSSK